MKNNDFFISRFIEGAIDPMADREYQIRIWVKGDGPECDSFDETINEFYYFFDILDSNYKEYGLIDEEFKLIRELEEKVDAFCEVTPVIGIDSEIVNDPRWVLITEFAKKIYEKLKRFH